MKWYSTKYRKKEKLRLFWRSSRDRCHAPSGGIDHQKSSKVVAFALLSYNECLCVGLTKEVMQCHVVSAHNTFKNYVSSGMTLLLSSLVPPWTSIKVPPTLRLSKFPCGAPLRDDSCTSPIPYMPNLPPVFCATCNSKPRFLEAQKNQINGS